MESRALVDWAAEPGLTDRPVDDWTAGDDLDFAVAPRRRRITDGAAPHAARPHDPVPLPVAAVVESSRPIGAETRPAVAARRTVAITGRPDGMREVPRLREIERRRRQGHSPSQRMSSQPDRIAMWAVALGFVLILIASFSG